jgi:hypothetical protein
VRERLVRLAKKQGVTLRHSYARIGTHALNAHQRYAHAKQFEHANKTSRSLHSHHSHHEIFGESNGRPLAELRPFIERQGAVVQKGAVF